MKGRFTNRERAVALVLAVAIMAVLAVVGFSFASSARMERAATTAISDLARARLAAHAALQTFPRVLFRDAMYQPGLSIGGPMADHPGETGLFGASMGTDGQLQTFGNKTVVAELGSLSDESGKMNLNCFGNISKWDGSAPKTDSAAGTITNPGQSLYHGANHRFSSFEVSFEEFFYHQRSALWSGASDAVCRIRSARLAMAICLYRYGSDGCPGGSGDDDGDNADLQSDGLDNNGDGLIDERNEGVNEPDEYNPFDPDGDGDVNTANGALGDRRFESIGEFKTAITTVSLGGTGVAVSYVGEDAAAQAAEAERIFQLVRSNLTVHSYTHDARAICIDDLRTDKFDNDGDGKIDSADATGVATLQDILDLAPGGDIRALNPFLINVRESSITNQAQAVLLWLKLRYGVCYLQADETYSTTPTPLVAGIRETGADGIERGLKHALNIVDYRDADCTPTRIPAGAFGPGDPPRDVYGYEALHITEIGRSMPLVSDPVVEDPGWVWNSSRRRAELDTSTASPPMSTKFRFEDTARLPNGRYLGKMILTVPGGGRVDVTLNPGSGGPISVPGLGDGTHYRGVVIVSNNAARVKFERAAGQGIFTVSLEFLLPYVEITNWSRKPKAIAGLKILIGDGGAAQATQLSGVKAAFGSTDTTRIPGLTFQATGFDGDNRRGVFPGRLVVVYDEESFERNFAGRIGGSAGNGTWGDQAGEDFPICVMRDLFAGGFDGTQKVTLWQGDALVAGGVIDFRPGEGWGTAFSNTSVAAVRGYIGGDGSFWHADIGASNVPRWVAVSTPSPGRYKTFTTASGECPKWWWPTKDFMEQAPPNPPAVPYGLADCVLVGDRGYFRSPAEVLCLSIPEMHSETFSFETTWDGTFQPRLSEFLAYLVAARAPARVNINTAPAPVLAAAFCPIEPDASGYMESGVTLPTATNIEADRGTTYYGNLRALGARALFANTYKASVADNDGCNDGNDNNEAQEWLIRNANVFTLRSSVFSATVTGVVRNAAGRTVARHSLVTVLDRGRELDANWRPMVRLLSVTPGD